jgi:tetratricopeptide (TPR) repeat protein
MLPEAQRAALRAALAALLTCPAHAALADQVAELLGGSALLERIEAWLAQLDQPTAPAPPPHPAPRQPPRHPRRAPAPDHGVPDTAGVLRLIGLLEPARDVAVDPPLSAVLQDWLVRYPHLGLRAPEVVSALLGLLRQCPAAQATMRSILDHVALSRRQRQLLETALQTPTPAATPPPDPLAWEPLRSWPLARLLDTLADVRQHGAPPDEAAAARAWYAHAVVFARVGLLARAVDDLHACLRLQPEQPLAHFMLAQILHMQHQYQAAWQHTQQAWHALLAQAPQTQVLHLAMLNHLLVVLGVTRQYDHFPAWFATFERRRAELETTTLSDAQRRQQRQEEGKYALSQALYLASAPSVLQTPEVLEQQLDRFAQAIAQGTPATQQSALNRQAETLAHWQRLDDAAATYARVVQQWPNDRHAHLALALLTALRQATVDVAAADQHLAQALALACADPSASAAPLTPQAALAWLHQASPRDPRAAEVTDVLTVAGGIAVQRGEVTSALEMLLPLYALAAQPRQAYYLAQAYYARGQQAAVLTDQLQDGARALQYAQHALSSVPHQQLTSALVQEIQAFQHHLTAARQHAMDYHTRVCRLFTRSGVPFQAEVVEQAPDAPWLALHELVDLDEASGHPVVTVRLCFNANSPEPRPGVPEIALYAQHQHAAQRLLEAHGMDAVPWPPIAYVGDTAFDRIFPERLALNRDLVFLAYADRGALLRYARVLQQTSRTLATLAAATPPPSVSRLTATARWVTVMPLLHQRLRTLATATASTALLRQIETLREAAPPPSLLERLRTFPAFADASAYFGAVAEALRPLLDAPPAARPQLPEAADAPARPERRRQRRVTTPLLLPGALPPLGAPPRRAAGRRPPS